MSYDIFYSHREKILFYVAGYTDNSDNVEECIEVLRKGQRFIEKLLGSVDTRKIKTHYVTHSRRYKSMRVFYVEDIETAPEEAFVINGHEEDNGWTMWKWLHD